MKAARIGTAPPRAMFGDVGEVEHVMHLVRRYAEYAAPDLSPEAREYYRLRAQSVLIYLAKQFCDALDAIEIPERDVNDYHSILLSKLQEAYEEAMDSVHSAPDPGDWTDKKLDKLNRQLLAIQAINGDIARELGSVKHQRRKEINIPAGKKGGKATKEKFVKPGLDDLIRGALARGERMPVKAWADDYDVSRQTIYNAINRIKAES